MNASDLADHDDDWLIVTAALRIPITEFQFTFMRSSGPGGQNVNKVNTKVRLRWPIVESPSLNSDIKRRFLKKHHRRISAEGDFVLTSQRYRDQPGNIADCLQKLREMLAAVAVAPLKRKKTKPSRASRERRLKQKREQSAKKQRRRPPSIDQ